MSPYFAAIYKSSAHRHVSVPLNTMIHICCNFIEKNLFKTDPSVKFLKFHIKTWSIVFFGSDFYSLFCLKAVHNEMKQKRISNLEVVVVNNQSPVYKYSKSNDIRTHLWPPNLNGTYDFGVIVSFGKLIPKDIIEKFPLGILNVHASLLPKYRGGMPIVHAVKNGDTSTGVTVTRIKEDKFDVGEIILQKPCAIGENELMPSLYKRLTHLGCECLLEILKEMPQCLDNSFPQSEEGASYAPRLKEENSVVRWDEMTALEIFNLHRALFGTFELNSTWKENKVKFICLFLSDSDPFSSLDAEGTKPEPGSFIYSKKTKFLHVQCKDKPIAVCSLRYKKKIYTASSFYAGYIHNLQRNLWKFKS